MTRRIACRRGHIFRMTESDGEKPTEFPVCCPQCGIVVARTREELDALIRPGVGSDWEFEELWGLLGRCPMPQAVQPIGTDSGSMEFELTLDGDVNEDGSVSVAVELDDDSEIVSEADGGISIDDMELEEGAPDSGALRGVDLDCE